ncbi:MAG: helix-turn-helix domain-containing protein [Gammaproteobacteria bacterium]|nr:helix-turn-helix domain-containing protein [Gammaproteobacteria bacterium]
MASRLGDKLRALRKEKKMTLEQLATITNISKSYIWELENREERSPSAEKLTTLADALGITAAYLIEQDFEAPEEQHLDEAFFRSYKKLEPDDKEQLKKIMETFKKKT